MDPSGSHTDNRSAQNDNFLEGFYTLELSLNLVELDPSYPKELHILGEHIRKARMDKHLMIKELAALVGVSPDTIINWEVRGVKPLAEKLKKVREVLGLSAEPVRVQRNGS